MMDEYDFDDSPIISNGDKSDAIGSDMENNTKSSGKTTTSFEFRYYAPSDSPLTAYSPLSKLHYFQIGLDRTRFLIAKLEQPDKPRVKFSFPTELFLKSRKLAVDHLWNFR